MAYDYLGDVLPAAPRAMTSAHLASPNAVPAITTNGPPQIVKSYFAQLETETVLGTDIQAREGKAVCLVGPVMPVFGKSSRFRKCSDASVDAAFF